MREIKLNSVMVNDLQLIALCDLKPIINNLIEQIDYAEKLNEALEKSRINLNSRLFEINELLHETKDKFNDFKEKSKLGKALADKIILTDRTLRKLRFIFNYYCDCETEDHRIYRIPNEILKEYELDYWNKDREDRQAELKAEEDEGRKQ